MPQQFIENFIENDTNKIKYDVYSGNIFLQL